MGLILRTINRTIATSDHSKVGFDHATRGDSHLSVPQKTQLNLECWETSIFFMFLRIDAPYRVPYLPQIPTFFVRLPMVEL